MEVFVEDVFIANFAITWIIFQLSSVFAKHKFKAVYVFISCFIAGVLAVLSPMLNLGWFQFPFKVICGVFLVFVAEPKVKGFKILFILFTFLAITSMLAGFVFAMPSFNHSSIWIILFVVFLISKLVFKWAKSAFYASKISGFIYEIVLENAGKIVKTKGYLDTGNVLVDPNSNQPVAFVDSKIFEKLFSIKEIKTLKNPQCDNSAHYIEVCTVNGKNKVFVFFAEKMKILINGRIKECNNICLGFSKIKACQLFGCSVLLPLGIV
ncbi:MAG: sigma-E processing peptidase SpoIIGA [Clostridia bacterium]